MFAKTRFLIAVAAGLLIGSPSPAAPPSKALEEVLSWVPPDSAVFFHADVAALWKSKPLENLKKANPNGIVEKMNTYLGAMGMTPEQFDSFTVFMPKLKQNGDQQGICMAVTLNKPHNPKQIMAALATLSAAGTLPKNFAEQFKKERENVYYLEEGPQKEKIIFNFENPNRIVFLGPKGHDLAKAFTGEKKGPASDALAAVAKGKVAALGINFANMPDEIRMENLPPQMEPFKPLLHSDAVIATAEMSNDLALDVSVRCPTRPKTLEAEKSIGVLKTLLTTVIGAGIGEVGKDESMAKIVTLLRELQTTVKTAKITSDDLQASAQLKIKGDLDLTPLVAIFGNARSSAAAARTTNNLKQLGLAMHNYHSIFNGFPPAATISKKGKPLLSWRVAVLPYIEQQALYQQFKLDEPWDSEHNKKVFDEYPMPQVFTVEGVTKSNEKNTHFQVFRGKGAGFDLVQSTKIASYTDGTSNTIMIATVKTAVPWTKPDDVDYDPKANPHDWFLWTNDTTLFAFADGSVRRIKKTNTKETLHAVITKGGGEIANID